MKRVWLPEEAGSRTNIYTKKYKKTPNKYPRAYGQIKNKTIKIALNVTGRDITIEILEKRRKIRYNLNIKIDFRFLL